jgi:hypothetical protein
MNIESGAREESPVAQKPRPKNLDDALVDLEQVTLPVVHKILGLFGEGVKEIDAQVDKIADAAAEVARAKPTTPGPKV